MNKQDKLEIISDDLVCIFKKLDIPEQLKGHKYFHFAIMQAIENPKHFRTQADAFKYVAERLNISVSAFRDGVHRATTCFWESNNVDKMANFYRNHFCIAHYVPTDFEFIVYMASYLRTKHDYI